MTEILVGDEQPTHWRVTSTISRTFDDNVRAQDFAASLSAVGIDTKITALVIEEREVT